jgi:hypothetical protein
MLTFSYDGSNQRVAAALRAKGPQIIEAVLRKMNSLTLQLQAKIVGEKLQGQVLQHRTGKLAGSIRMIPAVVEGESVVGAVEGGGGPAFYGRVHEYGGMFNVKGRMITEVFGRKVKSPHESRAYTATFPERSFMRTSLEEMRQRFFEGLTQATNEGLQK